MEYTKHAAFMEIALKEAKKAFDKGEVPVGALVVKDDAIISLAHNLRESENSPLGHAELLAIEAAARKLKTRRLEDCTLYVTLEPCPMCAGAIVMANIKECIFAAYDKRQGCCGSIYNIPEDPAFFHNAYIIGGILEEESRQLLQQFFRIQRNKAQAK